MRVLATAFIAVFFVAALAACGGTTTPGTTPPPSSGGATVDVSETEFKISMPTTISAGTVTFHVTNNGTAVHAFEIQGNGIDEKTPDINPGKSADLTVTLTAGSYRVFCPIDSHAELGMQLTLTVQ